jgi:trk system potassium uptake protein TrkA
VKVLIAGMGRLGEQAAHLLTATGHQVTVIDRDRTRLDELGGEHLHRVVHGDACEPRILEKSGAHNTDLLLAATGDDEDNLVIALLAKRHFAVPRTLARVNDPDNAWLFDARWGVDVALPESAPLMSLIEEATGVTDTVRLVRLAAGVTVIETHIDKQSAAAGRAMGELTLPSGTVVAAIVHDTQPVAPDPDYRFQPGDTVLVVTSTANEDDIHNTFQ